MSEYRKLEEQIRLVRDALASYPGVRLLAATKTVPPETINYAIRQCGIDLIGENRVQELLEKYDALEKDGVEIHFIGSLQKNKVKYIADKVSMIHSLDSLPLALEIERRCAAIDKVMDVLIEINIAAEQTKGGIAPEELEGFYEQIRDLSHLRVRGLMTMAPAGAGEDGWRRYFTEARALFDRFCARHLPGEQGILSMGMSDSYKIALESGSNLVRLGSIIFGARNYAQNY